VDPALSWGPNVLSPVFYGYADYFLRDGAPTPIRVYYPSLDGSPPCAPLLGGPGLFPLAIFLHGQCSEAQHYTKWSLLPAVLARSGFVVAIPDLGFVDDPWMLSNPAYPLIDRTLSWMRTAWPHNAVLMAPPVLGIVGHSYGALLGGQLATTVPATAYASLGGGWTGWTTSTWPLNRIRIPTMLAWGTFDGLATLPQPNWDRLSFPKYRLRFTDGDHWDFLPSSSCAGSAGPCNLVAALAADFVTLFLSKFMPPSFRGDLHIGENLALPSEPLTTEQQFFAGGHLQSFSMLAGRPPCHADLSWATDGGSGVRQFP
jgi:pimeloyl-ACP methyl ester carboxylesterase